MFFEYLWNKIIVLLYGYFENINDAKSFGRFQKTEFGESSASILNLLFSYLFILHSHCISNPITTTITPHCKFNDVSEYYIFKVNK